MKWQIIIVFVLSFSMFTPDLLQLEELLSSPAAIWMSTDGYLMLYGSFNDSLVEEQRFSWYGTTNALSGNAYLYPEIRSLR